MDLDALGPARAAAGHSHVHGADEPGEQPPQHCRGAMAEHSVLAAEQKRGHFAALGWECVVPHRVDAAVDPVKTPGSRAMRYRTCSQAGCQQLRVGDQTALSARDPGHQLVGVLSINESPRPAPLSTWRLGLLYGVNCHGHVPAGGTWWLLWTGHNLSRSKTG